MIAGDDSIAEAKRRLRLAGLMEQLGFGDRAKKSARCPFHEDTSASFSVFTGEDGFERWKCFAGCGQGDAIDFLAKVRGLCPADAIREFKRMAGIEVAPAPAPALQPSTSVPQAPFDWQECVAALTPQACAELADWRGYSPKFVDWLYAQELFGLFAGERIAFPVHAGGRVVGCHWRVNEDGTWRFHPAGIHTAPLIIGDLAHAARVLTFESQWDMCAALDAFHWHIQPADHTAAVATRGASNGGLLAGLCAPDAVVYAFAQNDPAGAKWLAAISLHCGCKCLHVVTPSPHEDINDYTKAGAVAADIRRLIDEARPVPLPTAPDLHAAAPVRVSKPTISLPDAEDESPQPEFPVNVFPPPMAGLVAAVSRCERVPIALPAVCALGVVSAAIGAGLEVVSGPNRVTRANLFLLASAESGSGKSETFRLVAAPLLEHQTQLFEVWRQKTSPELQSEIRILDREITAREKKAAKCGDPTERERMLGELQYKLARKDELARRAAMPCIIAQDVTTERLAVLLRDNQEVIFSASADARKVVDNLLGRYNPGKTTDESLYLSAFSGDFVRVDRQGRDPVVLNKPCLSLCWLIQPDLLATMLGEQSLSTSGFLPRMLVCHTQAAPRKIEGISQALPESVRAQWAGRISDLLTTYHGAAKPYRIEATPEALALLHDFHNRIVDRRGGDLGDVGAFAARYAEQAWRLSVAFHAAFHGSDAHAHPLALETTQNGIHVCEWFIAAQLEILAKGRRAAAEQLETKVLELLETRQERQHLDYATYRDVHRARIVASADAARTLLDRMEREGVLLGEDIKPEHGGKTVRLFRPAGGKNPVPG